MITDDLILSKRLCQGAGRFYAHGAHSVNNPVGHLEALLSQRGAFLGVAMGLLGTPFRASRVTFGAFLGPSGRQVNFTRTALTA